MTPNQRLAIIFALITLPPAAQAANALGCLIEPEKVTELGSPVIGVIERINVERGDIVKKGQVLAILRSDVERAATEVARSRSQANAELQAAISNRNFAQQKFNRSRDLVERNFISQNALDEATNDLKIAEQKVSQARQQLEISNRELGLAEAQLALRSVKSPFDGIIAERYLTPGERVEEKPIFRVAQIDPLRVEVIVPATQFGSIKVGSITSIKPDLPSAGAVKATVTLVDKVVDAASNTFRVRLNLPNTNHELPAGLRCKIDFNNGAEAVPASTGIPANVPASAGAVNSRR